MTLISNAESGWFRAYLNFGLNAPYACQISKTLWSDLPSLSLFLFPHPHRIQTKRQPTYQSRSSQIIINSARLDNFMFRLTKSTPGRISTICLSQTVEKKFIIYKPCLFFSSFYFGFCVCRPIFNLFFFCCCCCWRICSNKRKCF